jgi:hypothetical protein
MSFKRVSEHFSNIIEPVSILEILSFDDEDDDVLKTDTVKSSSYLRERCR